MTDFYTQLERDLVAAGHRRLGQGRAARAVAGRGRALVAATAAVAVLAVAGAFGLPAVFDTASSTSAPATPGRGPAPAPVSLAGIRVAIFNGTTHRGLARAVADRLEGLHARIAGVSAAPGPEPGRPRTVVGYRNGAREQARRVAAALGGALVRPSGAAGPTVVPVAVFVGLDLARTTPVPPAAVPLPVTPKNPSAIPPTVTGPLPVRPAKPAPAPAARVPSRPLPASPSRPLQAPAATVPAPSAPPAALPVPAQPKTP
jgi:hypothetical protein